MAASEDALWDADDKSMQMVPRLRRIGVTAGCFGFLGLVRWTDSDATWVFYSGVGTLVGNRCGHRVVFGVCGLPSPDQVIT